MWVPDGTYRATTAAFGTGVAQSILTAWAAVSPFIDVFNSDAVGGESLYLDYIKLICSAAGASSTSGQLGAILDAGDHYTSGGVALTAVNVNSGKPSAAKAVIHAGALVASAATSPRQIGRDSIKTQAAPCWVVGDEIFIKFGNFDGTSGPTNGAATSLYPAPCGPCIIAPQTSLLIYLWNPANAVTPPSWEIEMGWAERS